MAVAINDIFDMMKSSVAVESGGVGGFGVWAGGPKGRPSDEMSQTKREERNEEPTF